MDSGMSHSIWVRVRTGYISFWQSGLSVHRNGQLVKILLKSIHPCELGALSVGCPAGLSVD